MLCEKCRTNMIKVREDSVQGWSCPSCGWNVLTTYIDKIYEDTTEYSVFIKKVMDIDKDKIKLIAKICGVNFSAARQMLLEDHVCIVKAKAPEIKTVIRKLEAFNIPYDISPLFPY